MNSAANPPVSRKVVTTTCTSCATLCENVEATVENNRVVDVRNVCFSGREFFMQPRDLNTPAAVISGKKTSLNYAIGKAAQLLANARFPVIYGLSNATTAAQRAAVSLADRIGATIDSNTAHLHAPGLEALAEVGAVGCTLGEIRERADLVVIWGTTSLSEPERFFERFLEPASPFLPGGIRDRQIVGIQAEKDPPEQGIPEYLHLRPSLDFEAIAVLRMLLRGISVDAAALESLGLPLAELRTLIERMKNCRYGVILYGSRLAKNTRTIAELTRLVQELNAFTAFNAMALRNSANGLGADNILAWQTGYPIAVNFSRGYPRSRYREFSVANMLDRGEPDVCLFIDAHPGRGFNPHAGKYDAIGEHLARIPYISIYSTWRPDLEATDIVDPRAAVSLACALPGLETGGTIYRMDDVPLPLRPVLSSPLPTCEELLQKIESALPSVGLSSSDDSLVSPKTPA